MTGTIKRRERKEEERTAGQITDKLIEIKDKMVELKLGRRVIQIKFYLSTTIPAQKRFAFYFLGMFYKIG